TKAGRVSHNSTCSRYLHQSSRSSVDSALLTEAHGLITDMLTDPTLPSHVAGGLRAIASLLSPPSSSMSSSRSKPTMFASVAVNETNRESDTEEPYTGERPSSFSKVGQLLKSEKNECQYFQRGRRNMPPSLLRRMSTSTWSTTTSATGMPTVEPEPQRKRCTSFRNVPGLSSPNTSTPPSITSPLNPYPMKGRSYSTTALPVGTLQQLQERRELKTPFDLYSFDSNNSILSSSCDVRHRDIEPDNDDERHVISFLKRHPKQTVPRFNLTSDYDSSNDSPSGSEATIDDSVLSSDACASKILVNKRQLISSSDSGKSSASSSKSIRDRNECSLCGCKIRHTTVKERSIATNLEPVWPNVRPQPPVVPTMDQFGRYVIHDTTYDIDEIAANQLLNRINEWDYPIFELYDSAGDAILSQLCYRIFFEAGLLEAFKIPIPEFLNYFRALEMGYKEKPCRIESSVIDCTTMQTRGAQYTSKSLLAQYRN
ncbi:cGMP-inhibited 3':5'-cyclic phosphodiesterase A-like protein, partial [Leptotrombidium deliense]